MIGSLCSGYGGLELGLLQVLDEQVAWHADPDPGASKILAHRYPDLPNFGDITAVDWSTVQPVEWLCAGWPCQPWSTAGKRKGADDERAIWPEIARAVRDLRPRYVLLENVAAIVAVGELARACGELAGLGYVGGWTCLRASDVGAPHGRNRCFIVAADARGDEPERWGGSGNLAGAQGTGEGEGPQRQRVRYAAVHRGAAAADTQDQRHERIGSSRGRRSGSSHGGVAATHTEGAGREGSRPEPARRGPDGAGSKTRDGRPGTREPGRLQPVDGGGETEWAAYGPAVARWGGIVGRPAPRPTEPGRSGQRLSPRFPEWMMGLPDGWVTDVPGLTRNAQLKAIGNGVVPQQAAAAVRMLLADQERAA